MCAAVRSTRNSFVSGVPLLQGVQISREEVHRLLHPGGHIEVGLLGQVLTLDGENRSDVLGPVLRWAKDAKVGYRAERMRAWPVSDRIGNVRNN